MEEKIDKRIFKVLDKNLCMWCVMNKTPEEANEYLLEKAKKTIEVEIKSNEHMYLVTKKEEYKMFINYYKELQKEFN